ncbi:MAG: hypothetical protein AAFO79_03805 [Pseudomonadota bacterium]
MRGVVAVLAVLGLTGCASQLPVRDIQTVSALTPGAVGTDVYAARRAAGEDVPVFAGENLVTVRAYAGQPTSHGSITKGKELADVPCKVSTAQFAADVKTPAKVRVPNYRDRSSPIVVECAQPGYAKQIVTLAPFNKSRSERQEMVSSGAAAGGLIGAVVGVAAMGIAEAAADPASDVFSYQDASVVLPPLNATAQSRASARQAASASPFGGS